MNYSQPFWTISRMVSRSPRRPATLTCECSCKHRLAPCQSGMTNFLTCLRTKVSDTVAGTWGFTSKMLFDRFRWIKKWNTKFRGTQCGVLHFILSNNISTNLRINHKNTALFSIMQRYRACLIPLRGTVFAPRLWGLEMAGRLIRGATRHHGGKILRKNE